MFLQKINPHAWVAAIATVAVAVAMFRMPYGYFMLLRLFLCAACVYSLLTARLLIGTGMNVLLIALAVLYNPIVRIPLGHKSLWSAVNVATVAALWILVARSSRAQRGVTR